MTWHVEDPRVWRQNPGRSFSSLVGATKPAVTMRFALSALLAFAATASAYDVVSLTEENYAELTDGKTVFLKFFAPWVVFVLERERISFG